MAEIKTHIKLTELDTEYNKYIAKIQGYIIKDDIESLLGKKSIYNYHNIDTHTIQCTFPSRRFSSNCELYLFMEAGEHDLSKWLNKDIFDTKLFEEMTNLFFDFINSYKISEGILKSDILDKKIFIHSDIKPDNIVLFNNKGVKELKFIDFGISTLSSDFIDDNSSGTAYMYKYLFTYEGDKKYKEQIAFRSPLFDTYCIIISYLQIIFYNTFNINFIKETLNFEDIIIAMNDKINTLTTKDNIIEKVKRILFLGKIIYDFHQKNIKDYILEFGVPGMSFDEKLDKYLLNIQIENLVITPPYIGAIVPIYKKKYKSNLENDYDYYDKIINYCLYGDIFTTSIS